MTERDADHERWQLALQGLTELSGQYQLLLKSMQNGFHTLSLENAALRHRLAQIEGELQMLRRDGHATDATLQRLLPDLAAIAAYVVAQRPPQPKPRPPRRVNGE